MGFSSVLLVFPDQAGSIPEHPPVGLGYLSQALEARGIEHAVIDMRLGCDVRALIARAAALEPDLIGISMTTLMFRKTYALAEELKRALPGVAIVAGGPHVSVFRAEVLRQCAAIDYAVSLEGEITLSELCQSDSLREIRGLAWREQGAVRYNGDRPFIAGLDAVPYPSYRRFALQDYARAEIPILTSRGCPYACLFCAARAVAGRRFEPRSARHVADELQYWHEKGVRGFAIIDDNFTLKRDRVLELCREIEARRLDGLEIRCPNGVRADRVDRELLVRMRSAGFRYLAFGVESGSERVLKSLRKGERLAAIRRSIGLACELGYEVALFFIVGFPGETWQDIEDSVELARSFPIVDAKFFNLLPVPGTDLYDWASERNAFTTSPEEYLNDPSHWQNDARWDPQPVFATPEMPLEQRVKALAYVAEAQRQIRNASRPPAIAGALHLTPWAR